MRRSRELVECAVLVAAILGSATLWSRSGLQAKDEPKEKHKCPLCGNEEVTFENTPEGAFAKFRFALASGDGDLMMECVSGFTQKDAEDIKKHPGEGGLAKATAATLKSCKIDGDKATLEIAIAGQEKTEKLSAVRQDGVWKIDMSKARDGAKARDCTNNLRQLGTYIVMYVSKYGSDRYYPGPGVKTLTALFNLPTKETAIAAGNYGLLLCKVAGSTWDDAHEKALRADDPACCDYECIDQKISDGLTQPQWPIAWDKKPHPDGTRNVLFFSGSVQVMDEKGFQAALALWPKK